MTTKHCYIFLDSFWLSLTALYVVYSGNVIRLAIFASNITVISFD